MSFGHTYDKNKCEKNGKENMRNETDRSSRSIDETRFDLNTIEKIGNK